MLFVPVTRPGSQSRLVELAELEFDRDLQHSLPLFVDGVSQEIFRLHAYAICSHTSFVEATISRSDAQGSHLTFGEQ